MNSSLRKGVYEPRSFFLHAALLRQAFAHCGKFLTAASRRSLGRVAVPMRLVILSDQLLIVALVGLYPHQLANQPQAPLSAVLTFRSSALWSISKGFPMLSSLREASSCVLRSRSPLENIAIFPFDLHVLGMPPAFILSQDQTRHG
jgi:hypothetical protein